MTERSKYLFSHLASLPACLALDFLLLLYSTQLCWKDILLIPLSHISNVILDLELFWLSVGLNFQSWPIFSPSASRCFLWSHDLLHRSKRDPASRCLHPPDQPHFSRGSDSKEILKSGGEKYIQPLWTNAVGHIWEILHELKNGPGFKLLAFSEEVLLLKFG